MKIFPQLSVLKTTGLVEELTYFFHYGTLIINVHMIFLFFIYLLHVLSSFILSSHQNSGIEKAFLFDVVSKIYIATDSSPVDMQSYELCCDMIDVVIDVSCIYGYVEHLKMYGGAS